MIKSESLEFINKCQEGDVETIQSVLRNNTGRQNKRIITANFYQGFRFACENGHLDIVKQIIERVKEDDVGAMITASDEYAFRHACANGHEDILHFLLKIYPHTNMSILDNYAFRKACENAHGSVIRILIPHIPSPHLLGIFRSSNDISQDVKIEILNLSLELKLDILQKINKLFSFSCINGQLMVAQHIYENRDKYRIETGKKNDIPHYQWDLIFRRTLYNHNFQQTMTNADANANANTNGHADVNTNGDADANTNENNKNPYLEVIEWITTLYPERYICASNDEASRFVKYYIIPLMPRYMIPEPLIQEKKQCEKCKQVVSDVIGNCEHQYCNTCLSTLTRPNAVYPVCMFCGIHLNECYASTYNYDEIRKEQHDISKEVIMNRFHPRNLNKFRDWGVDGFSDDEGGYDVDDL